MVRVRLVDSPISSESEDLPQMIELPNRMFADGEEPVGVRVLAYHPTSGIRAILRVLSDEEIKFIKASMFGKFVDLADKPAFSGRFARYILSRQLKVNKKHEVWFRFAGNPIRFSLREFGIVTGLPCGKFPKKTRKNKKELLAETPYWPTLFGGADVVSVSSVIRMLRKKTVVDTEIRIKYALLALVSSVLMPTNLKSKIPKEYVEMIRDLDEFFSFPWGRLAFDMLMTSIKEKDEKALCQNTFALKGFVHAMQLVMVDAVPALTEVVQEAGSSSSDSDSNRDDDDVHEKHLKRLTLSPGHARDVDQKCEVPVNCIIEDNSSRTDDNEYADYSDEETDPKVENVLLLLSENHTFNNSMFKGGLNMDDIERMGGKGKNKKRETKAGKKAVASETFSESKIVTLLFDKMKPEILKFRELTKNLNDTVKDASEEIASMESRIGKLVENKIKSMIESVMVPVVESKLLQIKGEIIQGVETLLKNQHQEPVISSKSRPSSVPDINNSNQSLNDTENIERRQQFDVQDEPTHFPGEGIHDSPRRGLASDISGLTPPSNVTSLDNQMDYHQPSKPDKVSDPLNVSTSRLRTGSQEIPLTDTFPYIEKPSFSLGLSQEEREELTDGGTTKQPDTFKEDTKVNLTQRRKSLRLKTSFKSSLIPSTSVHQISEMEFFPLSEIPSFSLGLSQEDNNDDLGKGSAAEKVAVQKVNCNELQECRKGKRQKTDSHGLVNVFQCNPDILDIAREAQMGNCGKADSWQYTQKYTKLAPKLKTHFVINIGGCHVSNKDIIDIVERAKPYSSKVMDILMKHLSLSYAKLPPPVQGKKSVFFDTKFIASLSRNYIRFSKASEKDSHMFSKGLLQDFGEVMDHHPEEYRFYLPFNLDKKHWVGLCVDTSSWIITIFDCNTSLRSETSMSSEVKPIAEMFPYLMRQAGLRISNTQLKSMGVERAKTVPQNIISADSALTSVLLMQAHSLSGIESCRCIAPLILASEAQRFAVMLYEYHMKL